MGIVLLLSFCLAGTPWKIAALVFVTYDETGIMFFIRPRHLNILVCRWSKIYWMEASILVQTTPAINIRRRTKEIWTQAPSGGKQANPVETFLINYLVFSCQPQWCSGYNTENQSWQTMFKSLCGNKFVYTCIDYLNICIYNLYNFSLNIVNKCQNERGF